MTLDPDDDWADPTEEADVPAAELEAMWDATEAEAGVVVRALPAGALSQAPYPALAAPVPARPEGSRWREAGRSWDAAADQTRAQTRSGWWWHRPARSNPDVGWLRRRAGAARSTGRALDALAGVGYVILHDRVIAGTGEVLDHVAARPPGLLVIAAHPVTRLTRDTDGVLYDAGEPFPAEVTALRRRAQQLLEAVSARRERRLAAPP